MVVDLLICYYKCCCKRHIAGPLAQMTGGLTLTPIAHPGHAEVGKVTAGVGVGSFRKKQDKEQATQQQENLSSSACWDLIPFPSLALLRFLGLMAAK